MKGANKNFQAMAFSNTKELFHSVLHLSSGFVGKGQRSDAVRLYAAFAYQPGNAIRDNSRLA